MAHTDTVPLNLGSSATGLTLKAQVEELDGTDIGSEQTAGFYEAGMGNYSWTYASFPDDRTVGVKIYTGTLPTGLKGYSVVSPSVATTVWAAAARTLTAISDSSGVTTLLARIASALTITSGKVTVGTNDDKTGYALTGGEHTNIATDTQSGLTAQGYTTARATYLDTLNGLVAAIWASGTRTLSSYGTLVSDTATAVWAAATRTLTSISDSSGITTLLTRIPGTVAAQSGDAYARLGAPAGASVSADVAAVKSDSASILAKLGAITGSGVNTVLGFFRALTAKASSLTPSDLSTGTTFNNTTDALEAIRDRGDAAWLTGEGGGGAGSGDTEVDHDSGGAGTLRFTVNGVGVDNGIVFAYTKEDYDAGIYTRRGTAVTNSEGCWTAPMLLDAGITYTFVFYAPDATVPGTPIEVEVE